MHICYLEASKATWRSTVYDHFDVTLRRENEGQLSTLVFVFNCKVDPAHHTPHLRARMSTGHGTKNIQDGVKACNKRVGDTSTTISAVTVHEPYSAAAHRTLIATICVVPKTTDLLTLSWMKIIRLRFRCSVLELFSPVLKQSLVISKLFIPKCQRMFGIISW